MNSNNSNANIGRRSINENQIGIRSNNGRNVYAFQAPAHCCSGSRRISILPTTHLAWSHFGAFVLFNEKEKEKKKLHTYPRQMPHVLRCRIASP